MKFNKVLDYIGKIIEFTASPIGGSITFFGFLAAIGLYLREVEIIMFAGALWFSFFMGFLYGMSDEKNRKIEDIERLNDEIKFLEKELREIERFSKSYDSN